MEFITQLDIRVFIHENYITLLAFFGLLILMSEYRGIPIPGTRTKGLILLVLFLMTVASSLERWGATSLDRIEIRRIASIVFYILSPALIWLELLSVFPKTVERRKFKLILLSLPLIVNTLIYATAPLTGALVFTFDPMNKFFRGPLGYTVYYMNGFYLSLLLFWSFRLLKKNERNKGPFLFYIFLIFVLTVILEGFNIISGYTNDVFALCTFLFYQFLVSVHERRMQTALAEKEQELSESRIRLLRQQISPHFVFNALAVIKSLIRKDREKAVRCVEDFSDYLRANVDVLSSDRLIPFGEELTHVEAYVSIVKAEESRPIDMQYDLQETDFLLPPLTVEPLVENAIRHGLPNGGTVTLSTRAENDAYLIEVSDNGIGFNGSGTQEAGKRSSIGLENVQARLRMLCGGTLSVASGSEGATLTIRLPKPDNPDGNDNPVRTVEKAGE
jgi:two-component sensor histidine kinase